MCTLSSNPNSTIRSFVAIACTGRAARVLQGPTAPFLSPRTLDILMAPVGGCCLLCAHYTSSMNVLSGLQQWPLFAHVGTSISISDNTFCTRVTFSRVCTQCSTPGGHQELQNRRELTSVSVGDTIAAHVNTHKTWYILANVAGGRHLSDSAVQAATRDLARTTRLWFSKTSRNNVTSSSAIRI